MKNCVVSLFIVISCILIGCEDTVVNSITEESKDIVIVKELEQVQLKVEEETKNQLVLPIKEKQSVKRKIAKTKAKFVTKSAKSEIKAPSILVDDAQGRRILDLTLPTKLKGKSAFNNSYQKQAYLPDLFRHKKNKKKYALQIDGKIIDRVENEADKVSSADGVGIDVKLYP